MSKRRRLIDGAVYPVDRVKTSLTSKQYVVAVLLKIIDLPLELVRMILDFNKLPHLMIFRGSGAIRGNYDLNEGSQRIFLNFTNPRYFTPIVQTRFNPNHSSFQPAPLRRIDLKMKALFNAPQIEELED
jgi:hypothetical protein